MKKLLLCIIAICFCGIQWASADEIRSIRMDNRTNTNFAFAITSVNFSSIGSIGFDLKDVDDDGNYSIEITIENNHDSYSLYVFTRSYSAKDLRRLIPSLVYTKAFKEDYTSACEGAFRESDGAVRITPGQKAVLTLSGNEKQPQFEAVIPLYFAKKAKCVFNYDTLLDVRKEVLQFDVEILPTYAYEKLSQAVEDKMESLSGLKYTVCNHKSGKKHHPSLESQQEQTRISIDSLRNDILSQMPNHEKGSRRYQEYEALLARLDGFDISSVPVVDCPVRDQICSCPEHIASMSMEQIYRRIEELYFDIYRGKVSKNQVMGEVNALKVHSGHVKRDPTSVKSGIIKYYNRIRDL